MQAVDAISASTALRFRSAHRRATASPDDSVHAEPRALVPILSIAPSEFTRTARPHPLASFVAHLIAVRERAPQTRRRGRAAPQDGAAAYAAASRPPAAAGHLRKSA
jgi:hypothetical protein